jgi:hypothetical protein
VLLIYSERYAGGNDMLVVLINELVCLLVVEVLVTTDDGIIYLSIAEML